MSITLLGPDGAAYLRQFLGALFPKGSTGFVEVRAFHPRVEGTVRRAFFPPTPEGMDAMVKWIDRHAHYNIFLGVALRLSHVSGSLINCGSVWAVYVDLDFKAVPESETRERLARFPLPSSIVVNSGGGLHTYWLLDKPVDLQDDAQQGRASKLLRQLAHQLGGDLSAAEPARILRIPGTANHKYQPPRRVTLEQCEPERRYSLAELEAALPEGPPSPASTDRRFTVPEKIGEGRRNTTLHQLARSLHAKGVSPETILTALKAENATRCEPPLPEQEVEEIARKAATQPDQPGFNKPGGSSIQLVRLADVNPQPIEWLWPGRIPRGKLTLLIGDPGAGKSTVALDFIARITTGKNWPDGQSSTLGSALLLSAEDGVADTIRPRVDLLAGDPGRVWVIRGVGPGTVERLFSLGTDLAALEAQIKRVNASVVIIDPLSAYLGKVDSFKDAEVRGLLAPVAALTERTGVTVIGILHLTKDTQRAAVHRTLGSIAFTAAPRAIFAVAKDPEREDRRFFVPVKLNLGPPPPVLAFILKGGCVLWEPSPVVGVEADTILGATTSREDRAERQDAEEFLLELLKDGREVAARDVYQEAKEAGITKQTLKRAKRGLGVMSRRIGGIAKAGEWVWSLQHPTKRSNELPKGSRIWEVDPLGQVSEKKAETTRTSPKRSTLQSPDPLAGTGGPLSGSIEMPQKQNRSRRPPRRGFVPVPDLEKYLAMVDAERNPPPEAP